MRYTRRIPGILVACCFLFPAAAQTTPPTPAPAQLTVQGDVPAPLVLKPDDLLKMPRQTVSIPDADGANVSYEGVNLREILQRAGVPLGKDLRGKALTGYVLAKAHDGYQVVFSWPELFNTDVGPGVLVIFERDGAPLGDREGRLALVSGKDTRMVVAEHFLYPGLGDDDSVDLPDAASGKMGVV